MRYTQMLLPTTKEIPSDAEITSHRLMLRAGMIRKLTGGIYSWLPLGYRVIKKIESIVREEMDRAGAQEVFMPAVQPAELWQESGRWEQYGRELLRFRDRHKRDYCIGPTHEEVVTEIMRNEIQTYRQLPKNLYQIQTKFRDEIRPRFGVMRSREFSMKDAYSFDSDEEGAEKSYARMFEAYERIFRRCGFNFRAVEADSGSIGGSFSHEFLVNADSGEDAMVYCTACSYAANREKAEVAKPEEEARNEENFLPLEEVHTPEVRTIEEVSRFLDVEPRDVVKTLIYTADGETVAVLVRGNEEVNEVKVKNFLGVDTLEMAMDDAIKEATGSSRGFAGPMGMACRLVADYSIMNMMNFVVGANREDHHFKNCNRDRDFSIQSFADLRFIGEGDHCPRCGGDIQFARGIEVGHVFKLGTKYTRAMNATFLDRDGKEKLMVMGCYGIGVSRVAAAAIEQSNDENGIIWPMSISPFQVIVTPVNMGDEKLSHVAEEVYRNLQAANLDVLFDDRDERAGVKFKDADLLGIPLRVTIGAKSLAQGNVEVKSRRTGDVEIVSLQGVADHVLRAVLGEMPSAEAE